MVIDNVIALDDVEKLRLAADDPAVKQALDDRGFVDNKFSNWNALSRELRSGMVVINASTPLGEGSLAMSAEPYGQSGTGVELGLADMESYMRRPLAWFNYG